MSVNHKESFNKRFPDYIPPHHRLYCMFRKVYRQSRVRIDENKARSHGPSGIVEDTDGRFAQNPPNPPHINKAIWWLDEDLNRPDIKEFTDGINKLKTKLDQSGLKFCSAAGTFVKNT